MALAIICELDLAELDARWIEALRRRHDPQVTFVPAHVTLVFPFEGGQAADIEAHAAAIAADSAPIALHLARLAAVQDPLGALSRLFLLPTAGGEALSGLHDALYSGPLAAWLRTDIAYAPHVTVGAFSTLVAAQDALKAVGAIDIAGEIRAFDLVAFDGRSLERLRRFPLGPNAKQPPGEGRLFCDAWVREQDLNLRPSGYEPDELPGCSIPRQDRGVLS